MDPEAIDASVTSLIETLASRCPGFAPAIFPPSFTPRTLADLCGDEEQRLAVQKMWQAVHGASADAPHGLIFRTSIDYRRREVRVTGIEPAGSETDALLGSLERTMELIVAGAEDAVSLAIARFLVLNDVAVEEGEKYRFAETYNVAYTVKVLVGNTPMTLLLGPRGQVVLPLQSGTGGYDDTMMQVLRRSRRPEGGDDDDDDDDDEAGGGDDAKKRRKKKRSGGGKGKGN